LVFWLSWMVRKLNRSPLQCILPFTVLSEDWGVFPNNPELG